MNVCPGCGGDLIDWSQTELAQYGLACVPCKLFVWYSDPGGPSPVAHTRPLNVVSFPRKYDRVPLYRAAVGLSL